MENQSEIIRYLDGTLIGFLEEFLNLFLAEGASVEAQQLTKISILFIAVLFIVLFFAIVFKFLKIWIASMGGHPEYIFFIIMTVLVFSFTGDFSFGGACVAIFFFYYWIRYITQPQSKNQNLNKKARLKQTTQRIGVARTAKLATGAGRKL